MAGGYEREQRVLLEEPAERVVERLRAPRPWEAEAVRSFDDDAFIRALTPVWGRSPR